MRKVLLTVMMVSSLLAFNACKKDGVQGPAGPAGAAGATGATGAAGPAGAVGAAGAKGADGTKILSGTVDPVTADGAVGDYFFNKTTKTLWGPKVAAGWAGTNTTLTGPAGNKFLAGAGVPDATNPTNATVGDFYYNTLNSTFYGPKLADGTWASALPIGANAGGGAITYNLTKGFEDVVEVSKTFGDDLVNTYSDFNIFSSYTINAGDMIRINQFPARADGTGGYSENREMIFESVAGSNIFNSVANTAAQLGRSTQELAVNPILPDVSDANKQVGARFRYSHNTVNPLATFTLTQNDIDRLKENAGASFGYLTYAKAQPSSIVLGANPVFATKKNIQRKTSTTNYYATYTARTKFNLGTVIPKIEEYKQDGKVFLKYRYYNPNTTATSNNTVINHPGQQAGWADITYYANSYAAAVAGYSGAFTTVGISDANPFNLNTGAGLTNFGGGTAPVAYPSIGGGGAPLGVVGSTLVVGTSQIATVVNVPLPGANSTQNLNGNMVINYTITSGENNPSVATYVGPNQLNNAANIADPVTEAFTNPLSVQANFITRGGPAVNTALTTRNYYSVDVLPAPSLTATNNAGTTIAIAPGDLLNVSGYRFGKDATYFTNTKLVKIQVYVIPGDLVKTLKAKGVNVDDLNEVSKYVKL